MALVDCLICGHAREGDREHITGAWLERELVKRGKLDELVHLTTPVCMVCNRRMNKHIEQPVQPLARSLIFDLEPRDLTKTQQKNLVRWGLKVMVLMSMSRFDADVPQSLLDWLAAPGRPWPPSTVMFWIGRGVDGAPALSDSELQALEPPFPWRLIHWGGGFSILHFAMFAAYTPAFAQFHPTHPAEVAEYLVALPPSPPRGHIVTWPPARPLHVPTFNAVSRFAKWPPTA